MVTFVATIHILACISLIVLVLMQDSKSGGVFTSQSSSNTLLGATGATSLASTLTKSVSIILLITCIGLAMLSSKSQKSIIDSATLPVAAPVQQTAEATTATSATEAQPQAPAATETAPAQNK